MQQPQKIRRVNNDAKVAVEIEVPADADDPHGIPPKKSSWWWNGQQAMQQGEKSVAKELWNLYVKYVQPLEIEAHLEHFGVKTLTQQEFQARPQVLMLGQYSTGKTSMIKTLTGIESTHFDIRPQPSTDTFMAIVHGREERIIHGNAATCLPQLPYRGLAEFGGSFLGNFQALVHPASILEHLTFVDSPGVLSGSKQRLDREYDFKEVCQWMAQRSDLILLTFDAHKLDISDEFKELMEVLRPCRDKVRCVLNKADQIDAENLVRVYGALCWNVGKIFNTPEVSRVYISSFWDQEYNYQDHTKLFDEDKHSLQSELHALPRETVLRRINSMVARIRRTKSHFCIVTHLRAQTPYFKVFGAVARHRNWILNNLPAIFQEVEKKHGLSAGDMPDIKAFHDHLLSFENFCDFPMFEQRHIDALDRLLDVDVPELMAQVSGVTNSALSYNDKEEATRDRGFGGFFGGLFGSSSGIRKRKSPDT
jgi:GTP-binding protein EngB required for normal cell division